jgi:DNA-binding beta-propeller fold protein YncE
MRGFVNYRFVIISFLILTVATFSTSGDALGDFLFSWDVGYGFYNPQGIVTDGNGNIYIADTNNHRIQVISYDGLLFDIWGSLGTGDRQFNIPRGIEVDGIGNVYVVDTYNHRVEVLSTEGTFLKEWGELGSGEGQFYYPQGVAADALGNVYVADTFNNRIQVFSTEGIFLRQWGNAGTGDGRFYYPQGITADALGNVYVADTFNNRIQVFDIDGIFLGKWGSAGTGEGQFFYPYDITVDDLIGVVYVADTYNNRIQAFEAYGAPPVNEIYNFSGFLPPLNSEKIFKIGRAVPIKFKLTDSNGDLFSTAQASIMLQQYFDEEATGNIIEPTSKGGSNIKNTFRYDVLDEQYIYNLNTKGLSEGMWQIIVFLDDGTMKHAFIFLRK